MVVPGEQLDHYRIEGIAGHDSYTATFRATDLISNRQVAIKIPYPEMEADPVFSERFQREQEIGKLLDHPGLVKVLADGAGNQPYIVTEWFEGESLRQRLTRGKVAQDRAISIAASICTVLEYVHRHGVVHSDLTPEHVLVDPNDRIKLIHFGVATKVGARRLTFTRLSEVVDDSPYISPEELRGKRGDSRSDIYSVGVMLYEMLTGTLPFQGSDPGERLSGHPVPPREIDPAISPELQEVIYRALEREPRSRYASAHELARDLVHLDQVGVADRPELRDWKKKRTLQLRKVMLYAALALIPIAIFGLLLYFARH